MGKYVRLKDSVIQINSALADEEIDLSIGKGIPRADTIEELCDAFVVKDTRDNVVTQITNALQKAKNQKGIYEEIYGAIWTDKGLIYVAKMNKDGELELI